MFCSILKAKLDIEAKVNELQQSYLKLLSAPVREIEFTEKNNEDTAKKLLEDKIENLKKIQLEYSEAISQQESLSKLIAEGKETAESLETQLDSLFEALNIEIPEEFKKPEVTEVEDSQPQQISSHSLNESTKNYEEEDPEEDKENSRVYPSEPEEEEEAEISDKEDYYSPKVLISRSLASFNADCYTPALKSHSSKRAKPQL